MALEVEACWPVLQWMRALPVGTSSQLVTSAGLVDVLGRYTRLLPKPGGRGQLSFVSKYLHFCVNDAYPIWDKNARTALAQPRDPQTTWASYKAWLKAIGLAVWVSYDCRARVLCELWTKLCISLGKKF